MAYNDETVRAKLSQLNETQDSIMTVSQWIQFHKRHASRTAQIWAKQVLSAFPPKRLSLIYLANDVVQQTKNRGKGDFYQAFSPVIVDAFGEAYSSANSDTRNKLRRVSEIWRARNVFDPDVQNAIEKKMSDVDKGRGAKGKLGGDLFASGGSSDAAVPSELKELVNLQTNLSKAAIASSSTSQSAAKEFDTLTAPDYATPTPPVHAARLNQLLKSLSFAHASLETTLSARDALISGLEKQITENRTAREKEEMELRDLKQKRPDIEERKSKVEDAIMRGLSAEEAEGATAAAPVQMDGNNEGAEIPRPDFEELTPPPMPMESVPNGTVESLEDDGARTPTGEVPPAVLAAQQEQISRDPRKRSGPQGAPENVAGMSSTQSLEVGVKRPGDDILPGSVLTQDPRRRSFENHTFKRRKTEEVVQGDGLEGLDDDVVGMLG
ncbi:MAG: hypothetical protein Q9162_005306 [Coniocarpon cinnabarinum]